MVLIALERHRTHPDSKSRNDPDTQTTCARVTGNSAETRQPASKRTIGSRRAANRANGAHRRRPEGVKQGIRLCDLAPSAQPSKELQELFCS